MQTWAALASRQRPMARTASTASPSARRHARTGSVGCATRLVFLRLGLERSFALRTTHPMGPSHDFDFGPLPSSNLSTFDASKFATSPSALEHSRLGRTHRAPSISVCEPTRLSDSTTHVLPRKHTKRAPTFQSICLRSARSTALQRYGHWRLWSRESEPSTGARRRRGRRWLSRLHLSPAREQRI